MSIKTICAGEIHRMHLEVITFRALEKAVISTYGSAKSGSWIIRYQDEDGDIISISSTVELEEAFRIFGSATLKLFVSETRADSIIDDKSDADEEEFVSVTKLEEKEASEEIVEAKDLTVDEEVKEVPLGDAPTDLTVDEEVKEVPLGDAPTNLTVDEEVKEVDAPKEAVEEKVEEEEKEPDLEDLQLALHTVLTDLAVKQAFPEMFKSAMDKLIQVQAASTTVEEASAGAEELLRSILDHPALVRHSGLPTLLYFANKATPHVAKFILSLQPPVVALLAKVKDGWVPFDANVILNLYRTFSLAATKM